MPIEELRAAAGRGALVGKKEGETLGQRWVLVTGLVPRAKQTAEYKDRFENATDARNTTPVYVGFVVQRAEVLPGWAGEPKWEEPVFFPSEKTSAPFDKWKPVAKDVVDPRYVEEHSTSPLPPLAVGEWGEEVAHLPQVPLAQKEERPAPGPARPAAGACFASAR